MTGPVAAGAPDRAEVIPGAVMVIAKVPEQGRVKTRLCPPLGFDDAAAVAWACLLDTLDAAGAVPAARHVIVLDGAPGPWLPAAFEVIAQRGGGLEERLAHAFIDVAATAVVVAMDTPQVTPELLAQALRSLGDGDGGAAVDATIGPASDGGYWLVGLRAGIDPLRVFGGIPMSEATTGAVQRARLEELGLRIAVLDELRDIDDIDDLLAVVASHRPGRLTELVGRLAIQR